MATNRQIKAVTIKNDTATLTLPTSTATLSTIALSETLTNKTLTAPVVTSAAMTDTAQASYEQFAEIAAPSSPAANKHRVYFKSDGKMYRKNSSGTETEVGGGAEIVAAQYRNDTGQSIANATDTLFQPDTMDFDTHSAVTTGAGWRFTAPITATYAVSYAIGFLANGTGIRYCYIKKNGSLFPAGVSAIAALSGSDTFMNGSILMQLTATDYIEFWIYQSSGGSLATSVAAQLADAAISIHSIGI